MNCGDEIVLRQEDKPYFSKELVRNLLFQEKQIHVMLNEFKSLKILFNVDCVKNP